jgi:hypothetical protein
MTLEPRARIIKCDQTEGGIRLEIFPRFKWRNDFWNVVSLCVIPLAIGRLIYEAVRTRPHDGGLGLIFGVWLWTTLMWLRSSETWKHVGAATLTHSPAMLTTQQRAFGMVGRIREFPTNELHDLRLGWPTNMRKSGRPSELQIDKDYRTIVLVSCITEEEGTTLMARMMELQAFPKYPRSDDAA